MPLYLTAGASAVNTQTGTSYTLLASDAEKMLVFSSASPVTVTAPPGLGAGFSCVIVQSGAGVVTVAAASGVTVHSLSGSLATAGQYGEIILGAYVANTFVIFSASPGGSDTQLQWNNAGAFAGTSAWTTDGVSLTGGTASKVSAKQIWTPTQTLTDAATIAWDMDVGAVAKVTLAGNRTLGAPTNLKDGGTYILRVIQDGTGSRTLAYSGVFKWPNGTAPTLTTTANAVDIITFVSDGTNLYGAAQLAFS